jgi:transposase
MRIEIFYSTKDIAKLLGVSDETVRRWTRSGKLKPWCERNSKKEGDEFSQAEILRFLEGNPKYLTRIALLSSIVENVPSLNTSEL